MSEGADDSPQAAPDELRRTALHAIHAGLGARLVPFAGYEMPVQYSSIKEEHQAVRERAGLFDDTAARERLDSMSGMHALGRIGGEDAMKALERPHALWGGYTAYDLAVNGNCRDFVQECCAPASNNRWTGDLCPDG